MNDSTESGGSERPKGRRSLPGDVAEAELRYIDKRRKAAAATYEAPLIQSKKPPIGLALSGGGIRSATFCLGILQAFGARGIAGKGMLLPWFDYLGTVSGGGYIGGCLSSLLSRSRGYAPSPDASKETSPSANARPAAPGPKPREDRTRYKWKDPPGKPPFSLKGEDMPFLGREELHHLRTHGDYLIPRRGLVNRDFLRAVGHVLATVTLSLGLFLAAMFALGALVYLLLAALGTTPTGNYHVPTAGAIKTMLTRNEWHLWRTTVLAAGAAVVVVLAMVVGGKGRLADPGEGGAEPVHGDRKSLTRFFVISSVVILGTGVAAAYGFGGRSPDPVGLPLSVAVVSLLVGVLAYAVIATFTRKWNDEYRSRAGARLGALTLLVLSTALIALLPRLLHWSFSRIDPAVLGALASLVAARLGATRAGREGTSDERRSLQIWRKLLAGAVPVLLIVSLILVLRSIIAYTGPSGGIGRPLLVLGAGAILFAVLGFMNFNSISPHYFYRDRLADTFLKTVSVDPRSPTVLRDDRKLMLVDLHGWVAQGSDESRLAANPAPYHLVICAVNLTGSDDLARRNRKSDHFIFSRLYCGSGVTGYVPTTLYRDGTTSLATAMAISGAAASSGMGYLTTFTQSFAMTIFNVRLGMWLTNPRTYGKRTVYPEDSPRPTEFGGGKPPRSDDKGVFWPWYLLKEMFGSLNAEGSRINVSDGGHTGDNLGLYPLLQRRCRLIVACDGEPDKDGSFSSLAGAIRQINVDENTRVEIDLRALRPDASGRSRDCAAVGRITYPRDDDDRGRVATGWLVLLKATLSGRVPAAVESYRAKHPTFPYDTTADQFFDDDQFESYRALGEHVAGSLLDKVEPHVGADGDLAGALNDWCDAVWRETGPREDP
jgi:hypothetical protein